MNDQEILPKLVDKLAKEYSFQSGELPVQFDLSAIKAQLVKRVIEMLSMDRQRFINNLYMIDISESKVSAAMASKDKTSIPEKLADLIIERQLQRIKTQLLYKAGKL